MYFWPKAGSISWKANHKPKPTKGLSQSPFFKAKDENVEMVQGGREPSLSPGRLIQAGLYDEPAAFSEKRNLKTFY